MGKILAIDFGLKRTGLAITDENKIIASGLTTVESKEMMNFLIELTKKEVIETIVLGEPKRLNNEDSHITANVRLLKEALEKHGDITFVGPSPYSKRDFFGKFFINKKGEVSVS